jgi:hypothetical protein
MLDEAAALGNASQILQHASAHQTPCRRKESAYLFFQLVLQFIKLLFQTRLMVESESWYRYTCRTMEEPMQVTLSRAVPYLRRLTRVPGTLCVDTDACTVNRRLTAMRCSKGFHVIDLEPCRADQAGVPVLDNRPRWIGPDCVDASPLRGAKRACRREARRTRAIMAWEARAG